MIEEKNPEVISFIEKILFLFDNIGLQYVSKGTRIDWKKYKEFQSTLIWETGKRVKYYLDSLKGKDLPPYEKSAFHHNGRRNWTRIFSSGIFILNVNHRRGDNLLKI